MPSTGRRRPRIDTLARARPLSRRRIDPRRRDRRLRRPVRRCVVPGAFAIVVPDALRIAPPTRRREVDDARCAAQVEALDRCSAARMEDGSMQRDLINIGASECKPQYAAVKACQKRGGDCQELETALLVCSSATVVRALVESRMPGR